MTVTILNMTYSNPKGDYSQGDRLMSDPKKYFV